MSAARVTIVGREWNGALPGPGRWLLWYFADDYEGYATWQGRARSESRLTVVPAGDEINATAEGLRDELINLDARLGPEEFSLAWAASDLAERNPFTSDAMLHIARTVTLVEVARQGGQHLVVVDDPGFGRSLAAICRRSVMAVTRAHAPFGTIRRILSALRAHFEFLCRWRAERRALRRHAVDVQALAGREPWLMSWLDDVDSDATDRFLGPLPVWLRRDGFALGWLANPLFWMAPAESIAAAAQRRSRAEPVVLSGSFFGVRDLLRGYAALLRFPSTQRRRFTLAGIDLSPLGAWLARRERASPRLVHAMLYAGLAEGLKRRGLEPTTLFYTYENQPWEKAMLAGFRRALPATRLIGIQHAPLPDLYLSVIPSRAQWRDGSTPDLLLTVGDDFRARLLAAGAPAARVAVGGALRHADILSAPPHGTRPANRAPLVLATCSTDPRESQELAHKMAIASIGLAGVRCIVNFHPIVSRDVRATIVERVMRLVPNAKLEFVEGSARSWLPHADVLVYNSSSTSFEAAAMGVPMIYLGPVAGFDLDNMAGMGSLQCREPGELRQHIVALLSDSELRRRQRDAAGAHLQRCFSAAKPEFWTGLAQPTKGTKAA